MKIAIAVRIGHKYRMKLQVETIIETLEIPNIEEK